MTHQEGSRKTPLGNGPRAASILCFGISGCVERSPVGKEQCHCPPPGLFPTLSSHAQRSCRLMQREGAAANKGRGNSLLEMKGGGNNKEKGRMGIWEHVSIEARSLMFGWENHV